MGLVCFFVQLKCCFVKQKSALQGFTFIINQNTNNIMKSLLKKSTFFIALLLTATFFTSCEDDEMMDPETKSIVEIVVDDPNFSSLEAALTKAGLVSVLEGAGPFTVFAPDNDAFDALLTSLGVTLDDLTADDLTPILLYHVLGGSVMSGDLASQFYTTSSNYGPNGENLSLQVAVGAGVTLNGSSNVTTADVEASNGVIHVIDQVLLPPSVVDIAVNAGFTSLVAAVVQEGLDGTLSDGSAEFTVFAPTNLAFDNLLSALGLSSISEIPSATLTAALLYHVVDDANVMSSQLSDGMMVTTLGGDFTVNISGGTVTIDGANSDATVVITDIQGTNGIVHVIDTVLLP